MRRKGVVYYGPSHTGKTTKMIELMIQGYSCFDSDNMYPMFHIQGADPDTNPDASKVWARVDKMFIQLVRDGILNGVQYCFTASETIRDFLKENGWLVRTLSKVYKPEVKERSLPN
jgi:hypothetical protein